MMNLNFVLFNGNVGKSQLLKMSFFVLFLLLKKIAIKMQLVAVQNSFIVKGINDSLKTG